MFRSLILAALIATPAAAFAQDQQAETGQPPKRIRDVTLAAGQTCPKAAADEVVVCRPLEDPYRIPKRLRTAPNPAANQSWGNRAQLVQDVSRKAAGLPNTCSPIGTGGATGCTTGEISQWYAEQRQKANEGASIPR